MVFYWDQSVIRIISFFTLLVNIALVVFVIDLLYASKMRRSFVPFVKPFLTRYAFFIVFLITLSSIVGSLLFSELLHFPACIMCWIQRGLLYPQIIVAGYALLREGSNEKRLLQVFMSLSLLGAAIAIYQYYGQMFNASSLPCSALGLTTSCSEIFFTEFGYITIPMMSLTAFAVIGICSWLRLKTLR